MERPGRPSIGEIIRLERALGEQPNDGTFCVTAFHCSSETMMTARLP